MSEDESLGYWPIIEPIWYDADLNSDNVDVFLNRFATLTEDQKTLYPTHWLYCEVENGGFHQFFSNPTGILAPEAAVGFRALDMINSAEVVEKAMNLFGLPYPREIEKRWDFLNSFEGERREEFDPFIPMDSEFYDSLKIPDISESIDDRFGVATRAFVKKILGR